MRDGAGLQNMQGLLGREGPLACWGVTRPEDDVFRDIVEHPTMKAPDSLRPLILAAALLTAGRANAALVSDFSTSREGWLVATLLDGEYRTASSTSQADLNLFGGNPGGYISVGDPDNDTFWFQAPPAFLGDRSADSGTSLGFSLRLSAESANYSFGDVVLASPALLLVADAGPNPALDTWTDYSVSLSPSSWHVGSLEGPNPSQAQFDQVLSNLTIFRIRGEFYDGGVAETTSLDSVSFGAVPEPGSYAAMAALGLVGATLWRRCRSSRA